jgi:CRP-like cAMP-binding protein
VAFRRTGELQRSGDAQGPLAATAAAASTIIRGTRPTDRSLTAMPDPEKLAAVARTTLAAELDDGEKAALSDVLTQRDLAEGEVLVHEGASDSHLYVVVRGSLAVVKHAGTPHEVTFHTLAPGDLAGEMAFLDGLERYASLVAHGQARVLGLEREKLEGLLASHPVTVYKVMRAIIRVVHQAQRRLALQQAELTNYIYKQHGRY